MTLGESLGSVGITYLWTGGAKAIGLGLKTSVRGTMGFGGWAGKGIATLATEYPRTWAATKYLGLASAGYGTKVAVHGFNGWNELKDWKTYVYAAGAPLAGRYGPGVVKGVSSWKAWSAIGRGLSETWKAVVDAPRIYPVRTFAVLGTAGYAVKLQTVGYSGSIKGELLDSRTYVSVFGPFVALRYGPRVIKGLADPQTARELGVFGSGAAAGYGLRSYQLGRPMGFADLNDSTNRNYVIGGGLLALTGYKTPAAARWLGERQWAQRLSQFGWAKSIVELAGKQPKLLKTTEKVLALGGAGYLGGYALKGVNTNDWTFFDKTTAKYGTTAAGLLLAGRYGTGVVKGVSSWKTWGTIGNGLGTFGKESARFPVKHPYLTAGALTIGGYEAKLIAVGPSFDANGQWTWRSELSDLRTHLFLAPAYAFGGYKLLSNIPALGRGFSNMYKNVP
ncbi:MAG: hypothetical protein PHQ96_06265, partial [Candidatus Omnitrophica bacterium]|nr:hypothetical protein [Candidatus Omnitrophota bacterium]